MDTPTTHAYVVTAVHDVVQRPSVESEVLPADPAEVLVPLVHLPANLDRDRQRLAHRLVFTLELVRQLYIHETLWLTGVSSRHPDVGDDQLGSTNARCSPGVGVTHALDTRC